MRESESGTLNTNGLRVVLHSANSIVDLIWNQELDPSHSEALVYGE